MSSHQIHVFISHAWGHSEHYETLSDWIFEESWSVGQASLDFRDYSVPKSDPIHSALTTAALERAIFSQIARSHVIVIPTGMYASYSKWIKREISGADEHSKPILAVTPWDQERESSIVKAAAAKHVGWNKEPVIKAIWQLFRQ